MLAGTTAGGSGDAALPVALRLGASMTLLQFAIGALNDLEDRRADAVAKPAKPIPAGLVAVGDARIVAAGTAGTGLLLAAFSGPIVLGLAVAVLAIGGLYDLALKGTPWSWLPFALGIPILPVYGWIGVVGGLPSLFLVVVPVAVLEGAALAVANALADAERDRAAGVRSVATALGARRAGVAGLLLQAAVVSGASMAGIALALPAGIAPGAEAAGLLLVAGGGSLILVGAAVGVGPAVGGRRGGAAWTAQAVGAAVLGIGWIAVAAASGATG